MTKGLLVATASSSLLLQAAKVSRRRAPLLVDLFTQGFVFRHPGELIFGTALLYYTRLFERQFGSAKYGSFVAVACGLTYALEVAAASLLGQHSASGPYPIIFASLVQFVLDVPPLHNFQVFGWRVTDKVCRSATGCVGKVAWALALPLLLYSRKLMYISALGRLALVSSCMLWALTLHAACHPWSTACSTIAYDMHMASCPL